MEKEIEMEKNRIREQERLRQIEFDQEKWLQEYKEQIL